MEIKNFLPEITLYNTLNELIRIVNEDFKSTNNEEETLLYSIFSGLKLHTYDFYEQSKFVLLKDKTEQRTVNISIGYNLERAGWPTIHIILPSEQPINAPIGSNEGFEEYDIDTVNGQYRSVLSYDSSVTYNLLITSDNTLEVILLYYFLKMGFASINNSLENEGLQNLKWGGSDLIFNDDLVPTNIFHRNFNVSFTYDYFVKENVYNKIAKKFTINSVIIQP